MYSSTCFEDFCADHQKVKIILYSVWYHHTQYVAVRLTCAPDGHLQNVMIPDSV